MGWRRNIYSYPPIGTPDSGAYLTVADLIAFHRALVDGKLVGPKLTAAALTPHVLHSRRSGPRLMMGYGLEFLVGDDDRVRYCQEEGANVGVSALLRHYPHHGLTLAILGVGEDAIREPVAAFDAGVPAV